MAELSAWPVAALVWVLMSVTDAWIIIDEGGVLRMLDDEDVNLEAESQTWRPGNVPSGNLT